MTLKKTDGSWSQKKITVLCTVVVAVATVVMAMPTASDYCKKAVSPWTQVPEKIDEMNVRLSRIEDALNVQSVRQTNETNFHLANKLIHQ